MMVKTRGQDDYQMSSHEDVMSAEHAEETREKKKEGEENLLLLSEVRWYDQLP